MTTSAKTLIFGWGNPGRLDDGLGPAFIEAIRQELPPGVDLDSDYQLTMEDSAAIAPYDRVLFVDADRVCPEPFQLRRIEATRTGSSFSTHSVAPGAVLSLCHELFQAEPEAWLLGIRGYVFDEFGEELSGKARRNLEQAVHFVRSVVETGDFRESDRVEETSPRSGPHEVEPCRNP